MSIIHAPATPAQLEQAAADNHTELFCENAYISGGGVKSIDGLTWTCPVNGHDSVIAFPALDTTNAGEKLDELMAYYRQHPCKAGCWSLNPSHPADLGVRLLARGFQPGWKPSWMALELDKTNTNYTLPAGVEIREDNETDTGTVKNLPYAGEQGAIAQALLKTKPELAKRFIARLNGKIVGHSAVFLGSNIAGIYNVGVLPSYRNQHIGKAVVAAACLYARDKGYQYAILNGTGRRMYEQIGFKWISNGSTWWLMNDRYITDPPSPEKVALAEAVGNGDIATLDRLSGQFTAADLTIPLNNGMTLTQLAAHYRQPRAAQWLADHGAAYTVLDVWDLGWKERAAAMIKEDPSLVNAIYGEWQATLLHIAAERNDIELAKLALSAHPDLTVTDKTYNATAPGWAEHLSRKEIADLIKNHS